MNHLQQKNLLDQINYLQVELDKAKNRNAVDDLRVSAAIRLINEVLVMLSEARNSPYQSIDILTFKQVAWKERALDIVGKLT